MRCVDGLCLLFLGVLKFFKLQTILEYLWYIGSSLYFSPMFFNIPQFQRYGCSLNHLCTGPKAVNFSHCSLFHFLFY